MIKRRVVITKITIKAELPLLRLPLKAELPLRADVTIRPYETPKFTDLCNIKKLINERHCPAKGHSFIPTELLFVGQEIFPLSPLW